MEFMILKPKKIFVAVTNDISTDYRVHKICSYLVEIGFEVLVYGRFCQIRLPLIEPIKLLGKNIFSILIFYFMQSIILDYSFFTLFKKFQNVFFQ